MIEAVLFDMDGVLIDSIDVTIEVARRFFESKGYRVDPAAFSGHMGVGMEELYQGPARNLGISIDTGEAVSFSERFYEEVLSSKKDVAIPGALSLIKRLQRLGISRAVVSSAPLWKVEANLKALGLSSDDFDYVGSEEDVKRNKPYPDVYLNAAIRLGADPSECLVVEDSLGGIKAGYSAGMRVLALATNIDAVTLTRSEADAVITDLSALPPFESKAELTAFMDDAAKDDGSVLYGAHYIRPAKSVLSREEIEKRMIEAAWKAWNNAYAPFSRFKVGAAILSARTGRIYTGCNVENSSYGGTNCAERTALFKAISEEGIIGIESLVVVSDDDPPAPPCAICRQVLSEFIKADTNILLVNKRGEVTRYLFSDLLPHPFIFPSIRK